MLDLTFRMEIGCLWLRVITVYSGLMQGVCIDLIIIISYKHSSVGMPVVPQNSRDGGGEVGQLEAWVCCLDSTQTIFIINYFIDKSTSVV